jgi:hypothetical protein
MKRMLSIKIMLCLSVLLVAASVGGKRPNFLFIVVDDQSPLDLKVYNKRSPLAAPNIERLAAEGLVFDEAHHMGVWIGGVCTPSRHMIMSGRTLWHIPDKPGWMMNPHMTNPQRVPPHLPQNNIMTPKSSHSRGLRPGLHKPTSPVIWLMPSSSKKWRPCSSPRCASTMTRGGCEISRTMACLSPG